MNHVFLTGDVTSAPESLGEPERACFGLVTHDFTLPMERPRADYHRIVAARTLAEFALRFLAPGDRITVVGKLRSPSPDGGSAAVEAHDFELIRVRSLSPPGDDGAPIRIEL